eukprot:m.85777 g.85777  ORF g.85777 m.85777 type:complete len:736 (+) comp14439_c3_seq1:189-2396(+)
MATAGLETVVRELGKGAFATVFLVKADNHAGVIACKRIQIAQLSQEKRAKVMKEVNILRGLQHPHIVRLYESFETGDLLHVHMEYVDGTDLGHLLKQHKANHDLFSQETVMRWFSQLCFAVEYVHSHNIIHRDIKPTNCFLEFDKDIVKLGDFGLSQHIPWYHPRSTGFVGTPYYMSPDVLNGLDYTAKADVWSLAVLLYELLTLHRPFRAENLEELKWKVRKRDFVPLSSRHAAAEIRDLFLSMLADEEQNRLSSSEVIAVPCVARAFSELHPFHRAREMRPGCKSKHVECHIAVLDCKKVPDVNGLLASRADSASLSHHSLRNAGSNPSMLASLPKASFVNISERVWRSAKLMEKGSHFSIKRGLKTLLKFPITGDRVFRAASEGHPHSVIVVRKSTTYAISLPEQQLLEPFLQHLDAEPTVRAGVPTQVDTFVRVYDRTDKSWSRVYMVSWKSHLFVGAYHLSLHQTEALPSRNDDAFTHWLPSSTEGCRIVLHSLDHGDIFVIADSPRDARSIILALTTAGSLSIWRSHVALQARNKKRSFSSSAAESSSTRDELGIQRLSLSVGGLREFESETPTPVPQKQRALGRSTSRRFRWSTFRKSLRDTQQMCAIEIFSPPQVGASNSEVTISTYRMQISPSEFRRLSRECTQRFPDAPLLRRRRSSSTAREQQMKEYMESVLARSDCRNFWLGQPQMICVEREAVFEDPSQEPSLSRMRRSIKWKDLNGEVSVV